MLGVAEQKVLGGTKVGEMFLWFETEETSSENLERPNFDLNRMVLYVRRNPCRMTPWTISYTPARQVNLLSFAIFTTPPHIPPSNSSRSACSPHNPGRTARPHC